MPLPAKLLSVPPTTLTSVAVKLLTASLKVKVSVAGAFAPRLLALLVIETVGAVVSMEMAAVLAAAVLVLPAASVWRTLMAPDA